MNPFFKKVPFAALLLGLTAALSGCKQTVEIENGVIPDEFLSYTEKFLGKYSGQMELRSAGISLHLEEGNRLVVTSADDLIATACHSKVGNLTKLIYREKDHQILIKEAFFDFDPNYCGNQIEGKQLHVKVRRQSPLTLDLTILDHYEFGWICDGQPFPYPGYPGSYLPPTYPTGRCWEEQYGVYQTGRLIHD